jgi:hypothetical protein
MRKKCKGIVLIPYGYKPSKEELWAAHIIATVYDAKVEFLKPVNLHGKQTPDIHVDGIPHEIKTPQSSNTKGIIRRLSIGARQANRLIVNASLTSLSIERLTRIAQNVLYRRRNIEVIIVISKQGDVTEIIR